MKTRAVRLHGKGDLRLDEFELAGIKEDQILARVVCDSLCMSTNKAAMQGADHKRVPEDIAENPVIVGHEFCGELLQVGSKWARKFRAGQKFSIQPAINYMGSMDAPGYSYREIGGDATFVVIPNEVMEMSCLLPYAGESYFGGAMAEPYSCVAGTFHAMYHSERGAYEHKMGIREAGNMAMLAGAGSMGLAAIDYILHCPRRPGKLVVADVDRNRLDRASLLMPEAEAAKNGVKLSYMNIAGVDAKAALMDFCSGKGYDDALVFAPVPPLVELADSILAEDGCLNFFAGPSDPCFSAKMNFYNVHYANTHVAATSGGNTGDMSECLDMMGKDLLTPSILITHIGGLNAVPEATLNLPGIPGGKKLIYTGIDLPLTAISDFGGLGETDPLFARLHTLCEKNGGLWNAEAERELLKNSYLLRTGEEDVYFASDSGAWMRSGALYRQDVSP